MYIWNVALTNKNLTTPFKKKNPEKSKKKKEHNKKKIILIHAKNCLITL